MSIAVGEVNQTKKLLRQNTGAGILLLCFRGGVTSLTAGISSVLQSFRHRNYLWLWLVVAFTNAGQWTFTMAVTWQVYGLTHSSLWSGAMMFASLAPNIVGAPIAGVLADKFERRRLIFLAILIVLGALSVLILLTMAHVITAMLMVLLTLAFGLASSSMSVLVSTVLPSLVPERDLYNAYSLQAMGQRGTEFIGPFMAAPLLAAFGADAAYILGGVLYAVAILFLFLLSTPATVVRTGTPSRSFLHSLVEGFQYIRKSPTILTLMILVGLHCSLTMAYMGMLPSFVQHELAMGSSFYGRLMSMVGLGSIIGTLLLAGVRDRRKQRHLFWWSAVLSGLSLSMLGLSPNPALAIGSILLVGSSQALFMTISIAIIQEVTDEHVRGRVTSVYYILAAGLMSVANLGFGALSTRIPAHLIMITSGILFAIVVGLYSIASGTFRRVSQGVEA